MKKKVIAFFIQREGRCDYESNIGVCQQNAEETE